MFKIIKKAIFILMSISTLLSNISILGEEVYNNLEIISISLKPYLEKIEEEVIYTGTIREKRYQTFPSEKYQYLIIELKINDSIEKAIESNQNNFKVQIDNEEYSRVIEDEFLRNYNLQPLINNKKVEENMQGVIIFEIPLGIGEAQVKESYLINKEVGIRTKLQENLISNITYQENIFERQFAKEQHILEEYYKNEYSETNPFIVVDPYGNAPLTALVLFETKEESRVKVKIKGKDKDGDIEYNFSSYAKHHEIPIIGLYAGTKNEITLETMNRQGETYTKKFYIETTQLPEYILNKNIKTVTNDKDKMQDGFIFVVEENRVVLDKNGDIRWFLSLSTTPSGVEEFLENGHMLVSVNSYDRWASMYEIDWLGKIHWEFSDKDALHHDAEEMDNGNILFFNANKLTEVDRQLKKVINSIAMTELINERESEEIRTKGTNDWFHENTIIYDDGDIILSGRNQHMIIRMDYDTKEVKWILSPSKVYEEYSDKYLMPIGEDFEWFYSQHQPSILPDLDNNKETIDILLFDNGVHRATEIEEAIQPEETYSRMVHYRINEKNKTVQQIWDFGKKQGTEFYSAVHSGAQYLEDSGNYLGTFDAISQGWIVAGWENYFKQHQPSKVVEVTSNGDIVFQAEFDQNIYRAYKITDEQFNKGYTNLARNKGNMLLTSDVQPQEIVLSNTSISASSINSDISNISYNSQYLNIEGWAYLEEYLDKDATVYLELNNGKKAYQYLLENDNRINIPKLDTKKGFKEPYINIQEIVTGKYDLSLILEVDGQKYKSSLPYYFTKEENMEIDVQVNNLLIQQNKKAQAIRDELLRTKYTLEKPLVIQDPYQISPLTAIVGFNTEEPSKVKVEVIGKTPEATITHEFEAYEKKHIVPVYGLYAEYKNQVILTITSQEGSVTQKKIEVVTDKMPEDMVNVKNRVKEIKHDENLMFMASTYPLASDNSGEIRWYLADKTMGGGASPIQRLQNGNLAILSNRNVHLAYYQTGIYELDLLGRVHNEFIIQGAHHEIQELSNGNFLIAAEKDELTTEDYIVEIDRVTGKKVREWDLGEVLGLKKLSDNTYYQQTYLQNCESMDNATHKEIRQATLETHEHDWLHNNAFDYNEDEGTMLVSARHQDMIFKFNVNTGEVIWILSDPNDEYPDYLKAKLLQPVGEEFEWQYGQHAITELPDGRVMLYDNGNFRSKNISDALNPNDNYSRAVIYDVNTDSMTVNQEWEFGKERGKELYTPYIGDVDYLIDNHYVINFGGILVDYEGNRYDSPADLFAQPDVKGEARIIEIKDGEIISEFEVTGPKSANTYRVEKMPLYNKEEKYIDLNIVSKRQGELRKTNTVKKKLPIASSLAYTVKNIEDEGDRVLINLDVLSAQKGDAIYIVLSNDKEKYIYDTKNTTNQIKFYINKKDILKGRYNVGILLESIEKEYYTRTSYHINIK